MIEKSLTEIIEKHPQLCGQKRIDYENFLRDFPKKSLLIEKNKIRYDKIRKSKGIEAALDFALKEEFFMSCANRGVLLERIARDEFNAGNYTISRELIKHSEKAYRNEYEGGTQGYCEDWANRLRINFLSISEKDFGKKVLIFKIKCNSKDINRGIELLEGGFSTSYACIVKDGKQAIFFYEPQQFYPSEDVHKKFYEMFKEGMIEHELVSDWKLDSIEEKVMLIPFNPKGKKAVKMAMLYSMGKQGIFLTDDGKYIGAGLGTARDSPWNVW